MQCTHIFLFLRLPLKSPSSPLTGRDDMADLTPTPGPAWLVSALSLSRPLLTFRGPLTQAKRITPMLTLDDMAYLAVPDPAVCNVCSHGGSVLSASVDTANTYRGRKKTPVMQGPWTKPVFCSVWENTSMFTNRSSEN